MKTKQLLFCGLLFSIFTIACSSPAEHKEAGDSVVVAQMEKRVIKTDSGRIEIESVKGSPQGKAILYNASGKKIGSGMFLGDKPDGAWLRFDTTGKLLSATHFSEGKQTLQLDVKDLDFTDYTNNKLGVSFKVPKSWKENSSPNQALVVSFQKEVNDTAIEIKPNFNVVRGRLQKGENLQTLAKMQLDLMHENYDRVEIVQENNVVIDSTLAFQRYGMYISGKNQAGFLNVILVSGQDLWILSCEAQNKSQGEFLKYQGVFQEIEESFHRIQ